MTQTRCNVRDCWAIHTIIGRDHYIDDVFYETLKPGQLRFQCSTGKHTEKDDGGNILVPFYDIDTPNMYKSVPPYQPVRS